MRLGCLNCTRKHLGQAEALMQEAELGYPNHKWLAVGQMAEAEAEILEDAPEIAELIRDRRLAYINGEAIDTLDLIDEITAIEKEEEE